MRLQVEKGQLEVQFICPCSTDRVLWRYCCAYDPDMLCVVGAELAIGMHLCTHLRDWQLKAAWLPTASSQTPVLARGTASLRTTSLREQQLWQHALLTYCCIPAPSFTLPHLRAVQATVVDLRAQLEVRCARRARPYLQCTSYRSPSHLHTLTLTLVV